MEEVECAGNESNDRSRLLHVSYKLWLTMGVEIILSWTEVSMLSHLLAPARLVFDIFCYFLLFFVAAAAVGCCRIIYATTAR